MTLRDLLDTFTASAASTFVPFVPPSMADVTGQIRLHVDNLHGIPTDVAISGRLRSGRLGPRLTATDRRVGVASQRTLVLPFDSTLLDNDQRIDVRTNGRTSTLILYRESLGALIERETSLDVIVHIGSSGTVRFEVR